MAGPGYRTINGRRVVVLDPSEYERLREKADEWEPPLPEPDADGNYPAVEYARVSLARKIIQDRRRAGLTTAELARSARIRPKMLNAIEHARTTPSMRTLEKIEQALRRAVRRNGK
jgi:ribosome-binding protein aMBF1 (putative translation factor)